MNKIFFISNTLKKIYGNLDDVLIPLDQQKPPRYFNNYIEPSTKKGGKVSSLLFIFDFPNCAYGNNKS